MSFQNANKYEYVLCRNPIQLNTNASDYIQTVFCVKLKHN